MVISLTLVYRYLTLLSGVNRCPLLFLKKLEGTFQILVNRNDYPFGVRKLLVSTKTHLFSFAHNMTLNSRIIYLLLTATNGSKNDLLIIWFHTNSQDHMLPLLRVVAT